MVASRLPLLEKLMCVSMKLTDEIGNYNIHDVLSTQAVRAPREDHGSD